MSEFLIDEDSPDIPTKETPKPKKTTEQKNLEQFKKTQREIYGPTRKEVRRTLIKMFRAACNGKNYYKKWFPELKDTGDFEAAFIEELDKLK